MKYMILDVKDSAELEQLVESHCDNGWKLHGSLVVYNNPGPRFVQALIRRKAKERKS